MIDHSRAPSWADLVEEANWIDYHNGGREQRDAEFRAWCAEHIRDPEDVGSAVEYEQEMQMHYDNQLREEGQ